MGTSANTFILDEKGNIIVVIHRHWDGGYDCHGILLADLLNKLEVVNHVEKLGLKDKVNGIHCLAATIVRELKEDAGNIYLYSGTNYPEAFYNYFVSIYYENTVGKILLTGVAGNVLKFGISPEIWSNNRGRI